LERITGFLSVHRDPVCFWYRRLGNNQPNYLSENINECDWGDFLFFIYIANYFIRIFYFATISIDSWDELKPALWVFAAWCGGVFTFLVLISMAESSVQASKKKRAKI